MTNQSENGAHVGSVAPPDGTNQKQQANDTPERCAGQSTKRARLNPGTKRAAMLRAFLRLGDRGMNCFEAALQHHDFILRTSVSEITRYHGIEFHKRYEQVPGHAGSRVDCVRYSLTAEGATKARELLGDDWRAAA